MFKMDIQKDLLYVARETLPKVMWWPVWEGSLGENGYMHMYGWVPSLLTWNYHNMLIGYTPKHNKKFSLKKVWSQ